MYKTLLLLLLTLHLLGDFYLQPAALSDKKEKRYPFLLLHCVIYAAVLFAGMAVYGLKDIWIPTSVIAVLHFVIDSVKYRLMKSSRRVSASMVYCIDQCLHILAIGIAVLVLRSSAAQLEAASFISAVRMQFPADYSMLLQWVFFLALIGKPANVTIKTMIAAYKPEAIDPPAGNVGAFIGTLERIIIALLLSVNQYAAIGLVLTAKSVARYERMVKEQSFAEYYLLGTLLSTLFVVASYLAVFTVL